MPEHRIRLAKAWSQRVAHLPPRRVDLPTTWGEADVGEPFELFRQFQWPRIESETERVDLELIDVPGLLLVRFHGRELLRCQADQPDPIRITLDGGMSGQQQLTLELDLTGVDRSRPWGSIALVIGDRLG